MAALVCARRAWTADGNRRGRDLRDRPPGIEKKELGEAKPSVAARYSTAARSSHLWCSICFAKPPKRKIPFSLHAAGRETSTDADAIHIAREGIATALVSVPNRYMHSPNEMVCIQDLDHAAELIAEVCRAVTSKTDFTAR